MSARPFLRYPGGKRLQAARIADALGRGGDYLEPFLGGGAVFFELARRRSLGGRVVLSDVDAELVDCWRGVQADPSGVARAFGRWLSSRDAYYELRDSECGHLPLAARAARLIWLNRHGFNGLHRRNRDGRLNTPWGRREARIDEGDLVLCARALAGVELVVGDGAEAIGRAGPGARVYADPPYWPVAKFSFVGYSGARFGEEEHHALVAALVAAGARGVRWLLSSSSAPGAVALYDEHEFARAVLPARRAINRDGAGRSAVNDLLVSAP